MSLCPLAIVAASSRGTLAPVPGWGSFLAMPWGGDKCPMQVWDKSGVPCVSLSSDRAISLCQLSSSHCLVFGRCLETPWGTLAAFSHCSVSRWTGLWGAGNAGDRESLPLVAQGLPVLLPCWRGWEGRDPSLQVRGGSGLCWMPAGVLGLCWRSRWCCGPVLVWLPARWSSLCAVVGHFTLQQEMSECPRTWLVLWEYGFSPIIAAEMQAISTSSFQGTSLGSSSLWLHHLSYQYITLLID